MTKEQSSIQLPKSAQVVIVGGGIIGCSVAYHLTKLGFTDVVLLERRQLTCGTTWHAAGLVPTLRATYNMSMLANYSATLYDQLEAETGQGTGFVRNGSLTIATNRERLAELKRGASMAKVAGFPCDVISPEQAKELWPLMNVDDVLGAIHLPMDGMTNPVDVTQALAKGARMGGAKIIEGVKVLDMKIRDGKAAGVITEQGDIDAEYVVNCSGMWAREFGRKAGVNVPLHAAEHFYVVTENMPDLTRGLPTMRDMDGYCYYKEDAGKILVGMFEPNAKPWGMKGIPEDFFFDQIPDDLEHLEPYLEAAMHRLPILERTGLQVFFNGPESFTPDDRYHLGEAPELRNYFVAAGFNSVGIQSAGGAGKMLAEWIHNGHAPQDLWDVDIRRNLPFQGTQKYLEERTTESLGLLYETHFPFKQFKTARGVRRSVLHEQLKAQGAVFGVESGWERANWFANEGQTAEYELSFGRQNWFDNNRAEHEAVRTSVGVIDQSSFSKYQIEGPDAEAFLNRICSNNVSVRVGKMVYTQWLNERGGIEADVTVTRLAQDRYLVVSGAACQTRDMDWLRRNKPDNALVVFIDVTSAYAVVTVMGPKSRDTLSKLTNADMSHEGFPFGSSQEIELGYAIVRASRITYVGELGWELYIPAEYAPSVYELLMEAGEEFAIKPYGYHTMNSLRMEKCYRHWGHDITDEDTALEAGLGFASDFEKEGGFIGKEALLAQKAAGPLKKRFVAFLFENPEPLCYHEEPIYANGKIVGRTTAGMFGHTVGATVAMGYVVNEEGVTKEWLDNTDFEIEVECERYAVKPSLRSFYDPAMEKIKC
ncbi:FAD-dependent oxidoreductase [Amphritea sp. 2_MG-2023]|uniref:GcvT family protein n=1 Tax=Amphritea TaxID=515417 RepID=UPI001C07716B|nr:MULTISPECIES: FAD-dependent oxidoreductase [Amphritea]MBU2965104.1 FAD-dependent oxidoreductase [Amphritea atlantica]MDO6418889.1 FAD-dependent oxidoreductase [Amphritea sp. 2_MG-2023]